MLPKFQTLKEKEEKAKRTQRIFSVFVVIILAASTAGFALLSSSRRDQGEGNFYNGFEFALTSEGWQTKVKDYYLLTQYFPKDVEYINSSGTLKEEDFQMVVYFVARTEAEKEAAEELDKHIIAAKKDYACLPEYSNEEECINKSIKSCSVATRIEKIVIFNETKQNDEESAPSIDYSNNCLTIKGNPEELIRATDKAIFLLFGVIKQ